MKIQLPIKMSASLPIVIAMFFFTSANAQVPSIEWEKSLGGSNVDVSTSIQQTSDGGYIVAGSSLSNNGDVSGNHGHYDYWIVKLDSGGNLTWQKCLGGSSDDYAYSIDQTTDDGYIVAGYSNSGDGDVSGNLGDFDYWIVKLDEIGSLVWQKSLGGSAEDYGISIQQTADGGFIVAGETWSNDNDVSGNHGSFDYWIAKLDATGNLTWQICLGGTNWDEGVSIQQCTDGGFVVAGLSYSIDGDVSNNFGSADYWVVKLDSGGNLVWQKSLGGSGADRALSIQQTTDGGFIVAGYSGSLDGDVSGNHGNNDYWITKLDSVGSLTWQKCLGGSNSDIAESIQQTADGEFVVAGRSKSNDGNVTGHHGDPDLMDYWLVKIDTTGNVVWQKSLGGNHEDIAWSIQQTSDGGFIVSGFSISIDGDVSVNHGLDDYWVVKLTSDVPTSTSQINLEHSHLSAFPNPIFNYASISVSIPSDGNVSLKILDLEGRLIRILAQEAMSATIHEFTWDALDEKGNPVNAGLYLLRLQTENYSETISLSVLK